MIGFDEANTLGNDGIKTSRKKLSLALPSQSQKKDLLCGENKKPKKLSLGLKHPFNDNLASSNLQTSGAKSDNNRLRRKLSLRPLGESELNQVSKTEVLAETDMEPEINHNQDERSRLVEFETSGLEETSMPDSLVVLDSDDSGEEEEIVSSRSRLSLARRRGLKCSRP